MKKFEYCIREICFDNGIEEHPMSKEKKIVDELNNVGMDGWRLNSFEIFPRLIPNESIIKILLEREIDELV